MNPSVIAHLLGWSLAAGSGIPSLSAFAADQAQPHASPQGEEKTAKVKVLEGGATLLQGHAPVRGFDVYMVGFHPMKDDPGLQMEAHHYCNQVNEDFAQCVLFDGNTAAANLNGVEYILSERLFQTLPAEERPYWHPHNGEILSGQLMAPGIPETAEKALMKTKLNSYGKTWHFWHTGYAGHAADTLPLGEPRLAWSINRDGEVLPALVAERDRRTDRDTAKTREHRADLAPLAHPQSGVDALKGRFGRETRDIPRVVDEKAAAPTPAPRP
ncbi:OBAP family protein [Pseudomonas sp. RIT-PI-AD]|uniref:OBAP family protein n=1 Tax=Pseudomonas sp. RIT-PI-AD TaxID=3035294 RepID=UPI0021DB5D8D|nr:OBAP family protein [Pseudomonas sp. RIT-PI-AD]